MVIETKTYGAIRCISSPRSHLPELNENLGGRFRRPYGVYILWCSGKGRPHVYVGLSGIRGARQRGDLRNRLSSHAANDEYLQGWTHCFVVIGKNQNLTPQRIRYIEARLLSLGDEANRCALTNVDRNIEQGEMRTAAKEQFLDDTLKCLEKFGVDWFSKQPSQKHNGLDFGQVGRSENRPSSPKALCLKSKGIIAHGYAHRTSFVVLKGSQAVIRQAASCPISISGLRNDLRRKGILDSEFRFTQDHIFNSRSQASKVVLANSNDGSGWR